MLICNTFFIRREREHLRSQSAPEGFQAQGAGEVDGGGGQRRRGGGEGRMRLQRGGGGGEISILPLIGERGIKSAEGKRKEEYR